MLDFAGSGKELITLSKSNYAAWKTQMRCALILEDLGDVVVHGTAEDDAMRTVSKDAKAHALLTMFMEKEYQRYVAAHRNARDVWLGLRELFKSKSKDKVMDLWRELFCCDQKPGESCLEYIVRVEDLSRELKDGCDQVVTDEMLCGALVDGTRKEYKATLEALRIAGKLKLEKAKSELLTVDNLLNEKHDDEAGVFAMKGNTRPNRGVTAGSKHRDTFCYHCGSDGHVRKDCREFSRAQARRQALQASQSIVSLLQIVIQRARNVGMILLMNKSMASVLWSAVRCEMTG
jgi:hypothetical protein